MLHQRLLIACFLIICTLFTLTNAAGDQGRCVPLVNFNVDKPQDLIRGLHRPVCHSYLREANASHVFVKNADYNALAANTGTTKDFSTDPTCSGEFQFHYSMDAEKLSRLFSADMPSPLCQRTLLSVMCFHDNFKCDPEIDNTPAGYLTEAENRPCSWICELAKTRNICSQEDVDYLKHNGFDLLNAPFLKDCNSGRWPGLADTNCWSPSHLSPHVPNARCELYQGEACRFFGSNTYVYIPETTSQDEMEALLNEQLQPALLAFQYNGQCAQSLTMNLCKQVFRGCYSSGLKVNDTSLSGTLPRNQWQPSLMPLALPPLNDVCDRWNECRFSEVFEYMRTAGEREESFKTTTGKVIPLRGLADTWFANCTGQRTYGRQECLADLYPTRFAGTSNYLERFKFEKVRHETPDTAKVVVGDAFPVTQSSEIVDYVHYPTLCPRPLVWPSQIKEVFGSSTTVQPDVPPGLTVLGGTCAIPCPQTEVIYTKSERKLIQVASDILVCLSMVFSGLLFLTMMVFNSQRRKIMLLKYVATYFCATVFMFIGFRYQRQGDTWHAMCKNEVETYHMEGFVLFISITVVYFLICSSLWWCMIALDLFSRLILARQYKTNSPERFQRDLAMNLFCFITPLICVGALSAGSQLGPDMYLPISFISVSHLATDSVLELQWVFFFFPILAAAFIGLILVAVVVVYLIRYEAPNQNNTMTNTDGTATKFSMTTTQDGTEIVTVDKKHEATASKIQSRFSGTFKYKLQNTLKFFGFVLMMLVFVILLVFNQADLIANKERWLENVTNYSNCLVLGSKSCELGDKMSAARVIVSIFAFCSPGFLMFIVYFVFSFETYQLWAKRIGSVLSISWLEQMGKDDYDSDDTNSNSSSSGSKGSSQVSSDIFAGGDVLRKGKTKVTNDDGNNFSVEMTDMAKSNYTNGQSQPTHIPLSVQSRDPNWQPTREQAKRRQTLFKGFTAQKMGPGRRRQISEHMAQAESGEVGYTHETIDERGEDDDDTYGGGYSQSDQSATQDSHHQLLNGMLSPTRTPGVNSPGDHGEGNLSMIEMGSPYGVTSPISHNYAFNNTTQPISPSGYASPTSQLPPHKEDETY